MDHFPIFLDVKHHRAVVVGGGEAAARKLELLIRAGATALVVAPSVNAEIAAWVAEVLATMMQHPSMRPACRRDAVIIATDDETLTMCAAAARRRAACRSMSSIARSCRIHHAGDRRPLAGPWSRSRPAAPRRLWRR